MRFQSLEKLMNLHDGYRRAFRIDQLQLLLIQQGQDLFLLEAHCPHRGYPLLHADVEGGHLRCPLHGYCFDRTSGELRHASEEPCRNLKVYEVIYRDNEVGLMVD